MNLIVALEKSQGIAKVIRIHPNGEHECVYKICVAIHVVNVEIFHRMSKNSELLVALDEKSGDYKSHKDSCFGDHESL